MRGHDHVRSMKQGMVRRQRLRVGHIEACPRKCPLSERGQQRGLVDHPSPRGIDEERPRLHRLEAAVDRKDVLVSPVRGTWTETTSAAWSKSSRVSIL